MSRGPDVPAFKMRAATRHLTLAGIAAVCLALAVQAAVAPEPESTAALIFKIGKFVHWPEEAFADSAGTLRLCIVGRDDFGASIDSLAGRALQGRVIVIARISDAEQPATECRIVFISNSERERVPALLNAVARSPVLTISDIDGFASEGGMIGLGTNASKVHFEINTAASARAGLKIGSQLLQIATLIEDQGMDATP
jgi:hypothetical protein